MTPVRPLLLGKHERPPEPDAGHFRRLAQRWDWLAEDGETADDGAWVAIYRTRAAEARQRAAEIESAASSQGIRSDLVGFAANLNQRP